MPHKPPVLPVRLRWMIRRDMPAVQEIENHCFDFPWSDDDFVRCLRQRNCIGMVAELPSQAGENPGPIVGFFIYEMHKGRLHILNFAVHEDYRFKGIGSQMAERLISKLTFRRRDKILAEVRESNLDAQMFFRSQGFRAISVLPDFYLYCDENAYLFQYQCHANREPSPVAAKQMAAN